MKYIKLFLLLAAVGLVFSCQETTKTFEGTASIGFDSDTSWFSFPSTSHDVNSIPITFTGSSNLWPIEVKVEVVTDYDGDGYPAVENEDFLITTTDLIFGEPSDYADSVAVNPNYSTTVTKYIEFTYPDSVLVSREEIRVKLRIVSYSHSDEIQLSKETTVVSTAISDIERLVGVYEMTGELYTMQVDETEVPGENPDDDPVIIRDTSYVQTGTASYPVTISISEAGSSLIVRGLFNEAYDPVMDTTSQARPDQGFVTQFRIDFVQSDDAYRELYLDLGWTNGLDDMARNYTCCLEVVSPDNKFVDGPVSAFYDSSYSRIVFGPEVTDNFLTLYYYADSETIARPYKETCFLKNAKLQRAE